MAKPTYRVQTPHGTFTRQTSRTYAFVVVARAERKDKIRARNAADLKSAINNQAYYVTKIANLEAGLGDRYDDPIERVRETHARNEAFIHGGWESALCDALTQSDAALAAPFTEKNGSWSSRYDLARKEMERLAEWYRDVRIFDVATGAEVAQVETGVNQ